MLKHRVFFDEATIAARVQELARAIAGEVPDKNLLLVGLLTGSFVFVADLARAAARAGLEPRVDFIATRHYGAGNEASGVATIEKDIRTDVRGRAVLLVDDILDTGITLRTVREHLAGHRPAWLRTCVMLDKPARRRVEVRADYVGFEVPDQWVIGYGLDSGSEGRGLPYIGLVESDAAGG